MASSSEGSASCSSCSLNTALPLTEATRIALFTIFSAMAMLIVASLSLSSMAAGLGVLSVAQFPFLLPAALPVLCFMIFSQVADNPSVWTLATLAALGAHAMAPAEARQRLQDLRFTTPFATLVRH